MKVGKVVSRIAVYTFPLMKQPPVDNVCNGAAMRTHLNTSTCP